MFITNFDKILANHSGWSGVKCKTCGGKQQTLNTLTARDFLKIHCANGVRVWRDIEQLNDLDLL
jgi:hypothetical protein